MPRIIDLETLPTATAQEVYDQVRDHLLKQNAKCLIDPAKLTGCGYRNKEGMKCAAGCLIADDEYNPQWENDTWGILVGDKKVPFAHNELIMALQKVHDFHYPEFWAEQLKKVAEKHELIA
jgi:hypothetical protein